MSDLELVEHHQPASDAGRAWNPYAEDRRFTHQWWYRRWNLGNRYSLWSVYGRGREVARIQMDRVVQHDGYKKVPHLGFDVREVEYFEVASGERGKRLGRAALYLVADRFPQSRLVAFSSEAAGFWADLDWSRYDHPNGLPVHWPFFVAPKGWPLH